MTGAPGGTSIADEAVERVRNRAAALAPTLGRTWVDDDPWALLTELTAIGSRMAGSDGERRAARVVSAAFERAGLKDVHTESFPIETWERGETTLSVETPGRDGRGWTGDGSGRTGDGSGRTGDGSGRTGDGSGRTDDGSGHTREFEAIALPYSPSGTVTGEFVDVGHGTPAEIDAADVEGRIVVSSTTTPPGSRFIHRMEKFSYAVEQGATGFIFVNHLDGQLPPTGSLTFDGEADAIAAGVSSETGAWLREYATNGSGPAGRIELSVDATTGTGESRNVVGRVGPETDERILLVAHYDGHDIAEGALDNGCGIVTAVTAAGILSEASLDVGVDVVAVGSEEVGLRGAERLAETRDLDRVAGVINVDGAGRFRDLVALSHTSAATAKVAETVEAATRQPIAVDADPHPFSDQWPFVRAGVPALQLHSDSGERGRGWGHTHADTRDKVDDRNIREHGMLTALIVAEMATDERDLPRLESDDLADAFRDAEFETGMRAAGLWPADWE